MAGTRYDGTTQVPIQTKLRWDGTRWIEVTIAKRWDGTQWVDLFPVVIASASDKNNEE